MKALQGISSNAAVAPWIFESALPPGQSYLQTESWFFLFFGSFFEAYGRYIGLPALPKLIVTSSLH